MLKELWKYVLSFNELEDFLLIRSTCKMFNTLGGDLKDLGCLEHYVTNEGLQSLPGLISLNLVYNNKVTAIPFLPNLLILNISHNDNITNIGHLTSLKVLRMEYYDKGILYLKRLKNLVHLDIRGSNIIVDIDDFPKLEILNNC